MWSGLGPLRGVVTLGVMTSDALAACTWAA
jgi:hypothetical protein